MKTILTALLLLSNMACVAQVTPGKLSFALPDHAGKLSLAQGAFKITELSAKPNGNEFGIRAEDGDLHLLGFLFVVPEQPHLTAESCRDEALKSEGSATRTASLDRLSFKSKSGLPIAIALIIPENESSSTVRAFVASGQLCADLAFKEIEPVTEKAAPMEKIRDILNTMSFDPEAKPTFNDAFAYATVEFDRKQYAGAAKAYTSALTLVGTSDDPLKWRRVTTDQLTMALGISGDLKGSRAVNEAAILRDPSYPLYYYNLACADAESGDAAAARKHLQQAFDRRANTLPGEAMPDPSTDDSILKLKSDKAFWEFVQGLNSKAKQ